MNKTARAILNLFSGVLIGGGAMLPGVSGGVLAVAFGLYFPLMELFTAPVRAIKRHLVVLIPVVMGMAVGFYLSATVLDAVFALAQGYAVCLFAGIILGTVPFLIKEAGMQGKIDTKGYLIMLFSCIASVVTLFFVKSINVAQVRGSVIAYVISGFIWGLSIVIPGINSSSILIPLGLYQQINGGIKALDMSVILPVGIGLLLCVLSLARIVKGLYDKHYCNMWCAVIGLMLGSVVMMLPFGTGDNVALCVKCIIWGFVGSYFVNKLQKNIKG